MIERDDQSLLPGAPHPGSVRPNRNIHALDIGVSRFSHIPVDVDKLYNPNTCPASHLPWLAWAFSVDEWNGQWTESQKRHVIASSFEYHKHKGTRGAIDRALAALGYAITLYEWFEDTPIGDPYTFRIEVDVDDYWTEERYSEIERVVAAAKNVRSHLSAIQINLKVHSNIPTVAATMSTGDTVEILPWILSERVLNTSLPLCASVVHDVDTIRIEPLVA